MTTTPHWREKAREALIRGGHHLGIPLAGMLDRLHYDQLLQLREQLVNAVAVALQSAYETGEHDGAHARRNLAALEWLALRGYPVGQEPGGHRVSASPEPNGDPWFDSWEECARNAGMPG